MAKHNENKLSVIYDKRQKDFVVKYPRKCDGALALHTLLGDQLLHVMPSDKKPPYNFKVSNFKEELKKRGYDLETLKFSVVLKDRQKKRRIKKIF